MRLVLAFITLCLALAVGLGLTLYRQVTSDHGHAGPTVTLRTPSPTAGRPAPVAAAIDDPPAPPPEPPMATPAATTDHPPAGPEEAVTGRPAAADPLPVTGATHWAPPEAPRRDALADRIADGGDSAELEAALQRAARLGDADTGRALLAAWCRRWPDDRVRRFDYASQLLRAGLFAAALEHLKPLTQGDAADVRAWHNRAVAHQALGQLAAAEAAWTHVLAMSPESPHARAYRGEVRLDAHDFAGAVEDLVAALDLDPQAADVALNLAWARESLGELRAAYDCALRAVRIAPEAARARRCAGDLAWRLFEQEGGGPERQAAIEHWRAALQLDPAQPEVSAALAAAGAAP